MVGLNAIAESIIPPHRPDRQTDQNDGSLARVVVFSGLQFKERESVRPLPFREHRRSICALDVCQDRSPLKSYLQEPPDSDMFDFLNQGTLELTTASSAAVKSLAVEIQDCRYTLGSGTITDGAKRDRARDPDFHRLSLHKALNGTLASLAQESESGVPCPQPRVENTAC